MSFEWLNGYSHVFLDSVLEKWYNLVYPSLLSFSHLGSMYFIYAWTYAYGIFFFFDPAEESQLYVTRYRDADRDCLFLRWRSNHANKTSKMDGELIYACGGVGECIPIALGWRRGKIFPRSLQLYEIKTYKEAHTLQLIETWHKKNKPV